MRTRVPAPFTTIAWRLLHIADCKIMYHEYAYLEATLTFPHLEAPRPAALAIARLERGQKLLRDDLTDLAEDAALDADVGTNWGEQSSSQAEPGNAPGASQQLSGQAEPDHAPGGGPTWPAWRIFWTMIEHDTWHGGELGTMRDPYRRRSAILSRGVAHP